MCVARLSGGPIRGTEGWLPPRKQRTKECFVADLVALGPVLALLALGADGQAAERAAPPANGWIAFSSYGSAGEDERRSDERLLWLIHPDGSGKRAVAKGGAPLWSPDGRHLAFVGSFPAPEKSRIGLLDRDGRGLRPVALESIFGWSPDSSHLLGLEDNSTLVRLDVRTLAKEKVYQTKLWIKWAEYSPDGRYIHIVSCVPDAALTPEENLINMAEGWPEAPRNSTLIDFRGQVSTFGNPDEISWSPDGKKMLIVKKGTIYVADPDGSKPMKLATGFHATWSPTGWIVYIRGRKEESRTEVLAIRPDGTQERPLLAGEGMCYIHAECLPGGTKMLVTRLIGGPVAGQLMKKCFHIVDLARLSPTPAAPLQGDSTFTKGKKPAPWPPPREKRIKTSFQSSYSVSPDGRWMFLASPGKAGVFALKVLDLDTLASTTLLEVAEEDPSPAWQPEQPRRPDTR